MMFKFNERRMSRSSRRTAGRQTSLTTNVLADQRGQAAMVTVAMFMIIFAVVSVAFTYIVVNTARTATNESVQSSAKSAAESGVEDAKRLLSYCQGLQYNGGSNTVCGSVLGRTLDDNGYTCDTTIKAVAHASIPDFNIEDESRVRVGDSGNSSALGNQEYYQCLKIATLTKDYEGVLNADSTSDVVYLRVANRGGQPINGTSTFTIEWHSNSVSEQGDQPASGMGGTSGTNLPRKDAWTRGGNRPAIMRLDLVGAKKSDTTVADMSDHQRAVVLRPSSSGGSSANLDTSGSNNGWYHPNSSGDAPIEAIYCSDANAAELDGKTDDYKSYACKATITVNLSNDRDYYMRINAIYKNTHFKLTVNGDDRYFDNIQPIVDVTGNSGDAYSRIQARIKPMYNDGDNKWYPEFALDTNGKVCKKMENYVDKGTDFCWDYYNSDQETLEGSGSGS